MSAHCTLCDKSQDLECPSSLFCPLTYFFLPSTDWYHQDLEELGINVRSQDRFWGEYEESYLC